ncbi:J domain-containing protein [Clostridium sp. Marseille-P299]|uniref:J domain-containing protein n=1 Tax=Clostridium sp. Marseille-P299 TaxID=1805477 RepID=UPI000833A831|nr:J domain-containing protein [Clostridium sp. Marseille-P299]
MMLDDLKRKLRELRKLESRIRFKNIPSNPCNKYIWDEYFSTKDEDNRFVKYNMNLLLEMDHDQLKEVFTEYSFHVYYQFNKENGINSVSMHDTTLLKTLELPPYASTDDIKVKFRELAKKYHPDTGGDNDKFIELVNVYKKLMDEI